MQEHAKNSDCAIDPMTFCCSGCGVIHSEECPDCCGSGFHYPGCLRGTSQDQPSFTDTRSVLVAELMNANPSLNIDQAADYAARMVAAELQEDYLEMYKVQQEALFGRHNAAA